MRLRRVTSNHATVAGFQSTAVTLTATCFPVGYNSTVLEPATTDSFGVFRYIDPYTMRLCQTGRTNVQHDAGSCDPFSLPATLK